MKPLVKRKRGRGSVTVTRAERPGPAPGSRLTEEQLALKRQRERLTALSRRGIEGDEHERLMALPYEEWRRYLARSRWWYKGKSRYKSKDKRRLLRDTAMAASTEAVLQHAYDAYPDGGVSGASISARDLPVKDAQRVLDEWMWAPDPWLLERGNDPRGRGAEYDRYNRWHIERDQAASARREREAAVAAMLAMRPPGHHPPPHESQRRMESSLAERIKAMRPTRRAAGN